jgi:hypothetical protein
MEAVALCGVEDYPQTALYGWWDYNDAYGA